MIRSRDRSRNGALAKWQKGLRVLRKFGADAHAWIPGIGYINGLSAGNYLDSAGTTAASVDGLIGRMNDAAQTLGPELGDGSIVSLAPAAELAIATAVVGKTYRLDVPIGCQVNFGPGWNTTGTATGVNFRVADGIGCRIRNFGASAVDLTKTCREVIGIHATQATAGNKPTLRSASGKFYAEFNGTTNYLSLSAVPFQQADDNCTIACFKNTSKVAGNRVIGTIGAIDTPRIATLGVVATTGLISCIWRDDAGVLVNLNGSVDITNTIGVHTGRAVGNVRVLRSNGTQVATNTSVLGATTVTQTLIGVGWSSLLPLNGNIYCIIVIKGTVSDADLLTLERFAGLFGGVSF